MQRSSDKPQSKANSASSGGDFDLRNCHEKIQQIVEYWQSIRPAGKLPGRQHFDPIDIPRLLSNLRVVDVEGDPPRFKTRVMGTVLRDFFGQEHTGQYLDDHIADFEQTIAYKAMVETVATKLPNWYRGKPVLNHEKDFATIERVLLPFAEDGEHVDMIVTCILFGDKDGNFY